MKNLKHFFYACILIAAISTCLTECSLIKKACPIVVNDICPTAIDLLNAGSEITVTPIPNSQEVFITADGIATMACKWIATGCAAIDTPIANGNKITIKQQPATSGQSTKVVTVIPKLELQQVDSAGVAHLAIGLITKVTHSNGTSEDIWSLLLAIIFYFIHKYNCSGLKKKITALEARLLDNATGQKN